MHNHILSYSELYYFFNMILHNFLIELKHWTKNFIAIRKDTSLSLDAVVYVAIYDCKTMKRL